jgi:alpha-mannosidase
LSQPTGERPVLYVVSNCHLDTQWRWTIRDTISEYLPATLRRTFELFERFPEFVLNFEGAFRYQLLAEYWPAEYRRLQEYARAGRWRVAGCMLDAPDVNIPSPESLVRHILYAARYFERELGTRGNDVFLPDCFGFGAALPTLAAHCGLVGFGTSKLVNWKAPGRIPFDLGRWQGVDGSELIAVLGPEGYGEGLGEDLSQASRWLDRIRQRSAGPPVACMFVGPKGDRGGGLDDESADWLHRSLEGSGPLEVRLAGSDEIARELTGSRPAEDTLTAQERAALPVHRGELLLPTHGTGCWTSQALLKRWNRRNELLADAAERAAVVADWLGGMPYPRQELESAWTAFLWHQMHDDLTGTSRQEAYLYTWNDQAASLNRFAAILADAVGTVARGLDTRGEGLPLVVFNPLAIEREDAVIARVAASTVVGSASKPGAPAALRVFGPDGEEVPSQSTPTDDGGFALVFTARLPPLGFAVFDVRPAATPCALATGLIIDERGLASAKLSARLDDAGDLVSLHLGESVRNLLAGPAGLELLPDRSSRWPAWEVLWRDVSAAPRSRFAAPATTRILERGPARVALEVRRRAARSETRQVFSLSAGSAGARLEVDCRIDWRSRGSLLKASFPTALESPTATYDLGVGAIERGVNRPEAYEVPAQQWADLSEAVGGGRPGAGLSVLNDCRYGWDRPAESTLRLSLLRSPRVGRRFRHQAKQDLGRHRVHYAFYPHTGGWAEADTVGQAARHNQPLVAFRTSPSDGPLGRSFSLLPEVAGGFVQAIKKAEASERIVLRLREARGEAGVVRLRSAAAVASAERVNGLEEPIEPATLTPSGEITVGLRRFALSSLAVELAPPAFGLTAPVVRPLDLPLDREAVSWHEGSSGVDFDGSGRSYPGELFPRELILGGVRVPLSGGGAGSPHCVACGGQEIAWPEDRPEDGPGGLYDRLVLILAAVRGSARETVLANGQPLEISAPDWTATIGSGVYRRFVRGLQIGRARPPRLERHPLAWVGGHCHDRRVRDEPYAACYLFRSVIPIPPGTSSLRLPRAPRLRIFAAAAVAGSNFGVEAASELYDDGR